MRVRRRSAVLLGLAVALVVGVQLTGPGRSRRDDVAVRRSIYLSFPVFPGAVKAGERSYEITGDGEGTGDYALTVAYRLPATATSPEVLEFLRRNLPEGWHEVTDDACARSAQRQSQNPVPLATRPDGTSIPAAPRPPADALMRFANQLTVFKGTPTSGGPITGLTFNVSPSGQQTLLTLHEPVYSCAPTGTHHSPSPGPAPLAPPAWWDIAPGGT